MDLEVTLQRDLHGELLGRDGGIECDYVAPHRETIDPAGPICYDAIRVDASPTLDGRLPVPSGWHLDAARCADHEVSALPYRTAGFDEALLTLEVEPVEGWMFAVDGESIRLLDRSPPDEGAQPVEAPPEMAAEAIKWLDYGVDRLCRQPPFLPTYRQIGYDAHVEAITAVLERQDGARDDDSSVSPDG